MDPIPSNTFYGRKMGEKKKKQLSIRNWVKGIQVKPSHIQGPRHFWKEFDKQAVALARAFRESGDSDMVCTFVYHTDNGYQKFVVAHPETYWRRYAHKPAEIRCSYEIIPENSPCHLYLDLEYSKDLNPNSDGPSMTNTIIDIFCAYFIYHWSLPCNTYNALNLDSSTSAKFSRHIIFNIKGVAFEDNYHVGRFVKSICKDIVDCVSIKELQRNSVLSCFSQTKLKQLFVQTSKVRRLFINTEVYTKNRHISVYNPTKRGKQLHLAVSEDYKNIPSTSHNDNELSIFLSSLVSYFITRKDLILLNYSTPENVTANCFKKVQQQNKNPIEDHHKSQHSHLNKYICKLMSPSKVLCSNYCKSTRMLVYEIMGHRYCENIGRCQKSSDIFCIVNVLSKTVYQKCHKDCHGFTSEPEQLPEEVCFQMDEDGDMLLSYSITEDI